MNDKFKNPIFEKHLSDNDIGNCNAKFSVEHFSVPCLKN